MQFKLLSQEQINEMYARLAMADSINAMMDHSPEGMMVFHKVLATLTRDLIVGCREMPDFSDELVKQEIQHGLNVAFDNPEITDKYGKRWFAEGTSMLEIYEAIEHVAEMIMMLEFARMMEQIDNDHFQSDIFNDKTPAADPANN